MPTPTSGASLGEEDGSPNSPSHQNNRRKRKRRREGEDQESDDMSPEEEASASPPAAVIAGRGDDNDPRRVSSPPSGSKFLHDDRVTRISEDGVLVNDCLDKLRTARERDVLATSECSEDEDDKHRLERVREKIRGNEDNDKGRPRSMDADDSCGTSDVEKFDGKIVYNPDGSAYIIEDSELSEDDSDLPQIIGDGCIVDGRGVSMNQFPSFPQIVNAFYVSRNPSLYNALYGNSSASAYANSLLQDKKIIPDIPVMHSYRVYTMRDNSKNSDSEETKRDDAKKMNKLNEGCSSVPVKPILMCFICKLSFGYSKSFVAHAMGDHNVALLEDEKDILGHKNASAIIQCVGKDKEPLVSFLEPLTTANALTGSINVSEKHKSVSSMHSATNTTPSFSAADVKNLMASTGISVTAQLVPKDQKLLYSSGAAGGGDAGGQHRERSDSSFDRQVGGSGDVEADHRHLQDSCSTLGRPNVQNQHVPETSVSLPQNGSSSSNNSSINIHSNNSNRIIGLGINNVMDLTRKSPISASAVSSGNGGRSSVSPGASPSPGSTLSPLLSCGGGGSTPTSTLSYPPQPPPNFLTGTTIGVCPDHLGGRPSGVECAKCELILSSSRLGGPLAGMHSRNSCKTLKCPKCNWHYKYQETLEIHMKEKHPETETSCIYCIAGQPHPRLARGETYTCGYKPYRCEVCNYSTTTKGNLSIHMQSDKHLNNMQELQNGGVSNADAISGPGLQTPPSSQHKVGSPGSAGPGSSHHSANHHHHHMSPLNSVSSASQKPKPTFRCDVCNYETNVARNLRIHMTSEKHTHNMMVLQQNVKHMQSLYQQSQHHHQHQQQLGFESLLHFHPGLTLPGDKPPPHTEAALADMAYNQALLIQMMTGGQLPPHIPPELAPHMDMGLNPETMEPPPEPADPNPAHLFQCCVCNVFSTDSLEALSHHLTADRTKTREQEILAVVAGNYVCKLCTYKTNLKANFQLHCKTDKHLQRLQHVNHVKEGGPRNEWKLKYVSSTPGGIQVRCHACDYYTNSAHKLQLHAAGQRHEASCLLFIHLRECESGRDGESRIYHCALCGFSSRSKLQLLQHVRSMKHLQMEQLHQLQRRSEGKEPHTDIGEIFQVLNHVDPNFGDLSDQDSRKEVTQQQQQQQQQHQQHHQQQHVKDQRENTTVKVEPESEEVNEQSHMCPYCNYSSSSEMRIQAHVLAQHSQSEPPQPPSSPVKEFLCPLCQDGFGDKAQLERHVMQIHSVNAEGLQRLLLLVDQSHWLNTVNRSTPSTPQSQQHTQNQLTPPSTNSHLHNQMISPASSAASSAGSSSAGKDLDSSCKQNSDAQSGDDHEDLARPDLFSPSPDDHCDSDENRCQACFKTFRNIDELCIHQNEMGHLEIKQTPNGPGYLCWKKGCNQYFQTAHSLQMHFREIHTRSGSGIQQGVAVSEKHVYKYRCNQCSLAFKTMEKLQLHSQYHLIRDATKCVLCGRSFRSVLALHKHVETSHIDLSEEELNAYKQSLLNNPLLLAGLSGQVLDPSTNDLLKKESLKTDIDDMMVDSEDSPSKDILHNQDDLSYSGNCGDGDNSDDSVIYKEQQFLEDYLNSQAIAEDSYNDPNRKYKCHRCKVAFTRQSYLTSHNKTLLHRKGEKLSYPMEKYLDPNRPYKCDVCKESFTQKNILLVHYNSVSHLHKLKRAMQEQQQQQNNNNNNNNNNSLTPVSPHAAAAAALAASLGVTPPPTPKCSAVSEDDDKKPYKCNICKVAYSQGSTLDIHMRSVLHQTRASKLQDLAITGQIDLSKPLIEQPEPQKIQDHHKKMLQDILGTSPKQSSVMTSPPSGGSSGSSCSNSSASQVPSHMQGSSPTLGSLTVSQQPVTSVSPSAPPPVTAVPTSLSTTSTNTVDHQHGSTQTVPTPSVLPTSPTPQQVPQGMLSCQRCNALFVSQEQLTTHQQLYCLFGSPMTLFPPLPAPPQSSSSSTSVSQPPHCSPQLPQIPKSPSPVSALPHLQDDPLSRAIIPNKKSSQVYKHLLESYGFDLVMQFNENHQRRQKREKEEETEVSLPVTSTPNTTPEEHIEDETVIKVEEETPIEHDIPELAKSVCQHCQKEFSSVWVLKAHCEEVHKDLVPSEFLEKYAEQIKSEYEKKAVIVTSVSVSTSTNCVSTGTSTNHNASASSSSIDASLDKDMEDNKEALHAKLALHSQSQQTQQPTPPDMTPPAPSTPTASSTPASSTDSIPATLSSSMAAAVAAGLGQTGSGANSQNLSLSLAQQMTEMQAALNAMAASQLQQQLQQFNPMMMGMAGLSMGLPLGLNMNALAAMNLQPPLVPMMMPPPPFDPLSLAQAQNPLFSPQAAAMDTGALLAKQQQHLLQQQQQAVTAAQQKRARTRITDDQLKILRSHFDINNSPSEEQIHEMASQSGLPPKVIKHWFRNTLFKERQRNKDSPYNFNNPPSTTLNLEEYEKTGEAKVMPLNTSSGSSSTDEQSVSTKDIPTRPMSTPVLTVNKRKQSIPQSFPPQNLIETIKTEPKEMFSNNSDSHLHKFNNFFNEIDHRSDILDRQIYDEKPQNFQPPPSPVTSVSSSCAGNNESLNTSVTCRSSSPANLTLTSIIASQLGSDVITVSNPNIGINMSVAQSHSASNMLPPKIAPPNFTSPNHTPSTPNILPLAPTSRSVSPARPFSNASAESYVHTPISGSSSGGMSTGGSSGKRANRTRFTDYQIKVLQEFFENNAYPKDDDLEYLSKLLSLSPRVIVVWFQNARQKARKVYENQPPIEAPAGVDENGANRFQRTPGLNYQCKKCLLVFQRYYELIRHQKTHCFKEEDAKRSAQAQAAAAQLAAVLSSEDSNSSTIAEQNQQTQPIVQQPLPLPPPKESQINHQTQSSSTTTNSVSSSITVTSSPSVYHPPPSPCGSTSGDTSSKEGTFQCDKCNLVFPRFELWREHQLVHIMNPNLFPTYPPDSPFGILQQQAQIQQQQQHMNSFGVADLSMNSSGTPPHSLTVMLPNSKRKFDDYDDCTDRESDQPKDKRLRTTILPEQLDYLYQKYQLESNPSRKMLENIAREVGLKKRVVQVWFQNTRARERKGQFRAHAQVINKRCPFCPALFKVKSALESHLVTKHADQCSRGEINIDALPDEEVSMESTPSFGSQAGDKISTNFGSSTPTSNMIPPLFPPFNTDMENSLKKYYEESMKRYLSELQAHHAAQNGSIMKDGLQIPTDLSMKLKQECNENPIVLGDGPLDLSKPVDLSRPMKLTLDHEMRTLLTEQGPLTDLSERSLYLDDDSESETTEIDGELSNPTSPASSTQSVQNRHSGGKRFRTQMSSLQVKAMKSLFNDYKTPTMAECEMLGREIGLPKRVVQVWFQNARAKEKKNKLALQKALGGPESSSNTDSSRPPEECKLCQFKYSHKYSIQDHIFTKKHIDNVKTHIENGKCDTSDGNTTEFTVPPIPGSSGSVTSDGTSTIQLPQQSPQFSPNNTQLAQLQMLQMAASGLGLPNSISAQAMAAVAAAAVKQEKDQQHDSKSPAPPGVPTPEDMSLLHQLYGLGLAGFPGAMQGNIFLHPAMFSAAGPPGSGGNSGSLFEPFPGFGGTPLSLLQLPQAALQAVGEACTSGEPGVSTVRVSAPNVEDTGPHCRDVESEVGFICKKCRLAFPGESGLLAHQRVTCYPGQSADSRGSVRLVQMYYECRVCEGLRLSSVLEFRRHAESEQHQNRLRKTSPPLLPSSSPAAVSPSAGLTHEMEDVVNQITLLAARAAAESCSTVPVTVQTTTDSNANIAAKDQDFDVKRVKLSTPVAVSSTGQ